MLVWQPNSKGKGFNSQQSHEKSILRNSLDLFAPYDILFSWILWSDPKGCENPQFKERGYKILKFTDFSHAIKCSLSMRE